MYYLFRVGTLSPSSGGLATSFDFIKRICMLNHAAKIVLCDTHVLKLFLDSNTRPLLVDLFFRKNVIILHDFRYSRLLSSMFSRYPCLSLIRVPLLILSSFFDSCTRIFKSIQAPKIYKTLSNLTSVCVVDFYGTKQSYKSKSSLYTYYYHAGSPDTYINSWLSSISPSLFNDPESYALFLSSYQAVIFQSHSIACEARSLCAQYEPNSTTEFLICRPAIAESSLLDTQTYTPDTTHQVNILSVGSVQTRKQQHLLVESMVSLDTRLSAKHISVSFVGDYSSEYGSNLKDYCDKLNLQNVSFTFAGHQSNLSDYYNRSHIFVQTSQAEGVSRSLREAAFLGMQILATDLPGVRELGLSSDSLYDCGDIQALTYKLSQLLSLSCIYRSSALSRKYSELWSAYSYDSRISECLSLSQPK